MSAFDRYPDWGPDTRKTDPAARVCRFRHVYRIRAVRITNASFRNAPANGVFELYEPEREDPIEILPSGKRQVKVICAWQGGKPNSKGSGARIKLSNSASRVEVLENYSGEVVDNIGYPIDPTPLEVDMSIPPGADSNVPLLDQFPPENVEDHAQVGNTAAQAQVGAGFGDPAENKLVELAAVTSVRNTYEGDGWAVRSVEREKCGFDLECTKDGAVENVEVKGVRGTQPCFIVTSGEVGQAQKNANFYLVVVTSALSASPKLFKYSGAEFCRRFNLSAIQYRAVLKPDAGIMR